MESRAILRVEPVARIERQEIDFSAFGQLRRLVQHEPAIVNARLQRHTTRIARGSGGSRRRVEDTGRTRPWPRIDNVATWSYIADMKTVGIRDLKNRLSEYVREVRGGEE